jgi:hypothetical protein
MKKTNVPKFLKSLFNLTANDHKIPTDIDLDYKIEELGFYMHYIWPLLWTIIKKKVWFFWRYKWQIWGRNLIVFALLFIATYFAIFRVGKPIFIKEEPKTIVKEIYVTNLKPFKQFVYDIGTAESGNDWGCHKEGSTMLGYFQFSSIYLSALGINVEPEYFLSDSTLQLATFKRNNHLNQVKYKKYFDAWNGKPLPQDKRYIITESGILMAFHLKPTAAIKYFESGCTDISDTDGNGTNVSTYIKKFSGYKIE